MFRAAATKGGAAISIDL